MFGSILFLNLNENERIEVNEGQARIFQQGNRVLVIPETTRAIVTLYYKDKPLFVWTLIRDIHKIKELAVKIMTRDYRISDATANDILYCLYDLTPEQRDEVIASIIFGNYEILNNELIVYKDENVEFLVGSPAKTEERENSIIMEFDRKAIAKVTDSSGRTVFYFIYPNEEVEEREELEEDSRIDKIDDREEITVFEHEVYEGYLEVEEVGNLNIIEIRGKHQSIRKEYLSAGDWITKYMIVPLEDMIIVKDKEWAYPQAENIIYIVIRNDDLVFEKVRSILRNEKDENGNKLSEEEVNRIIEEIKKLPENVKAVTLAGILSNKYYICKNKAQVLTGYFSGTGTWDANYSILYGEAEETLINVSGGEHPDWSEKLWEIETRTPITIVYRHEYGEPGNPIELEEIYIIYKSDQN
jgi:hypothetical protein